MLIVLAFKGLLTQLWCFIYGSEDLKQNTRNPWLGGIIIRAISLCFEDSAEGEFITKEDIFSFISFPLFQFPWHKFSFCRFRKKKKLEQLLLMQLPIMPNVLQFLVSDCAPLFVYDL